MIDFRYHLVSIIAVFFALAVGIVLGAGPLGERVDENLPQQLAAMGETNRELQGQIRDLEAEQDFRDGFVDAVTGELVSGRLEHRDVLVAAMPESDEDLVNATAEMLTTAGATVTGTVRIQPAWLEAESEPALDALATELVSSGITLPEEGSGYDRGAALLAGALLRTPTESFPGSPTGLDNGSASGGLEVNSEVMTGLTEAEFITVDDEPKGKASLAVVVAGGTSGDGVETLTILVGALDAAGSGAVAASTASSAAEGQLIADIRADGELADRVSTVDSVNLSAGRIAVVYAAAEQGDGGSGQYGYLDAEDGQLPPIPSRPDTGEDGGS